MTISARALNRSTLVRQALSGREPLGIADTLRRVVALQAQHPASPYLALWNRVSGFDPADLDAAFARGEVVKATLMRITLHAVAADDYPAFRAAVEPTLRSGRLDGLPAASGLPVAEVEARIPELLAHAAEPRTAAELEAWLGRRLGAAPHGAVWRALRGYAPLVHAPTGGPWSFRRRPSYGRPASPPATRDDETAAVALRTLVRRYLQGFGPASVADVAQFALVQRRRVREALGALSGELVRLEGPDGAELFDLPDAPRPPEDAPAPARLIGMWDSILLAYADRSRVVPPDYRARVTRVNGDVLPTLLVDGSVAGVWRVVDDRIEATAFHRLPDVAWEGLAGEARSLLALLADREPAPYRRYDHWWARLSGAEVRSLPGD